MLKIKLIEALDKITNKILKMNDEEFKKLIEEHKDGEYAKILQNIIGDVNEN